MVPSNSVRGEVCLWEALWSPPPRTKGKEGGPSTQTATLPSQQWACLLRPRPALGGVAMGGVAPLTRAEEGIPSTCELGAAQRSFQGVGASSSLQ